MKIKFLSALETANVPPALAALPRLNVIYAGDFKVKPEEVTPAMVSERAKKMPAGPICLDIEEGDNRFIDPGVITRNNERCKALRKSGRISTGIYGETLKVNYKNAIGATGDWNIVTRKMAAACGIGSVATARCLDAYLWGEGLIDQAIAAGVEAIRSPRGRPRWVFVCGRIGRGEKAGTPLKPGEFTRLVKGIASAMEVGRGDRFVLWDSRWDSAAGKALEFSVIDGPWSGEVQEMLL